MCLCVTRPVCLPLSLLRTPDSFIDIFFAGIDVSDTYPTGDSIGVLSTDDGCGNGEEVWENGLMVSGTLM